MPWRIAKVQALPGYCLAVSFLDGTQGKVDMSRLITGKKSGVFSVLRDLNLFNEVYVEYGVVTWPGELDLAPDAMYIEIKRNKIWIIS